MQHDQVIGEGKVIRSFVIQRFGPAKALEEGKLPRRCTACGENIIEGEYSGLIPLGPGGDAEEREKANGTKNYNAICVEIHWACATGRES